MDALVVAPNSAFPALEALAARSGLPVIVLDGKKTLKEAAAETVRQALGHRKAAGADRAPLDIPAETAGLAGKEKALQKAFAAGRIKGVVVLFGEATSNRRSSSEPWPSWRRASRNAAWSCWEGRLVPIRGCSWPNWPGTSPASVRTLPPISNGTDSRPWPPSVPLSSFPTWSASFGPWLQSGRRRTCPWSSHFPNSTAPPRGLRQQAS